jgi:hypothetical protein
MASEALTKFTEAFNSGFDAEIAQANEAIAKLEAKVKEYKEVHKLVLDYLKTNPIIKTEEFLKIFPEDGGKNTEGPNYATLTQALKNEADVKLKSASGTLFKLADSNTKLIKARLKPSAVENLKKSGADGLIGKIVDLIIGKPDDFKSKLFGPKGKPEVYNKTSWEGVLFELSEDGFDSYPDGLVSSAEAFAIVQEKYFSGELGKKSETAPSPINDTAAEEEKAKASSAINQPTGESPEKKEKSASITETGEVKKEPEPKSKVVSKTESINEPKPEPKPEGETAKKEPATEGKASVEEKKATGGTINIGEKESAELDKREKEEKQKQAKITNIVGNLKVDESKKSDITNILTRFSESRGKELAETPKGSLNESFEKGKELAQSIGKIGAPSTTVNQASTTTQSSTASATTANFENIQSTSTSQTINQTDQRKTTTSSAPVTNTSSKKTLTKDQQNIINDYKQKMGVLTPEEKKIRAELEQSIKIESGSAAPIKAGETVVEKGKTAFAEKVPANAQNTFASTQNTQNLSQTMPQSEKTREVTKTEIAAAPAQTVAEPSPTAQQSAQMDVSRLEQRLRNLEEILSSPLSVKVIG